jgi:hypothetical protein
MQARYHSFMNPSPALPELPVALRELLRRQVRAVVWLVVRIVALSALSASLVMASPWLRNNRWILDMLAGVLVLWPLWGTIGRNWGWRIALGKSYLAAGRHADALAVLRPLDGLQGMLFDATGEGRAALSSARKKENP